MGFAAARAPAIDVRSRSTSPRKAASDRGRRPASRAAESEPSSAKGARAAIVPFDFDVRARTRAAERVHGVSDLPPGITQGDIGQLDRPLPRSRRDARYARPARSKSPAARHVASRGAPPRLTRLGHHGQLGGSQARRCAANEEQGPRPRRASRPPALELRCRRRHNGSTPHSRRLRGCLDAVECQAFACVTDRAAREPLQAGSGVEEPRASRYGSPQTTNDNDDERGEQDGTALAPDLGRIRRVVRHHVRNW